ncbi:MAG: Sua5/YciO/YrdC/YwlC family protein [Planctomycetota bacterium]
MPRPQRFDLATTPPEAALQAATLALQAGELVVLPTETVYGLAALERHAAALARVKAARQAPYALAVPALEMIQERLAPLTRTARRCAARWWPGPLTLVLPDRHGGSVGVRVPGHAFTRELLAALGEPLLLTSANPTGVAPPTTAAAVPQAVLQHVAVVVDGGQAALGEASTVLEARPYALRLLREGVVSRQDVQRVAQATVLIVCSGNTCRSPMAAGLLTAALSEFARPQQLIPPRVLSAGLHTQPGHPASAHAIAALAELGLSLDAHRTSSVAPELLGEADLVLCMTRAHAAELAARLGPGAGPPIELFDPRGRDVEDPFGQSLTTYRAVAASLAELARERAARILNAGAPHR